MKLLLKYILPTLFIIFLISCNQNTDDTSLPTSNLKSQNITTQGSSETKNSNLQNTTLITSSQNGIWVSGSSIIMVAPDLVEMNLRIESINQTVSKAVENVSKSNQKLLNILDKNGVNKNDIKTTQYSINPQYRYDDGKSILNGYRVSHSTMFKYKELKKIGSLIDQMTIGQDAIGNTLRINSINYTIENPGIYEEDLRKNAIVDAIQKANSLATYSNVLLGSPYYISENSPTNFTQPLSESDMMVAKTAFSAPSTEISPGQLTIRFNVNMGFSINQK